MDELFDMDAAIDRVAEMIAANKKTEKEIAEYLSFSVSQVHKILRHERGITNDTFKKLGNLFDVHPVYFMFGDEIYQDVLRGDYDYHLRQMKICIENEDTDIRNERLARMLEACTELLRNR